MWKIFAIVALFLLAQPAAAEVSDKIASQPGLWVTGLVVGTIAFIAGAIRPLLGVLVGGFALFLAWGTHSIVADPHIGPAVLAEQGRAYWWAVYGSSALMLCLTVVGVAVGLHRATVAGSGRNAV